VAKFAADPRRTRDGRLSLSHKSGDSRRNVLGQLAALTGVPNPGRARVSDSHHQGAPSQAHPRSKAQMPPSTEPPPLTRATAPLTATAGARAATRRGPRELAIKSDAGGTSIPQTP
jgi:hypothetical protein